LKRDIKSRVSIRPPTAGDCAAFLVAVRRSRALHRGWINPKAATRAAFNIYLRRFSSGLHHGFLVIDRETGDIAGVINLNDVVRGSFQSASVGYYAFAPHAGRGLMRAGLRLVLKQAFGKLRLHRVEANIQPNNEASIALVKKCGFVKEGFSRRFVKVCGRWKDHERWAMLAEDFLKKTKVTMPRRS
jgi:ribosomal-protein-alanine N-acetyltransferase